MDYNKLTDDELCKIAKESKDINNFATTLLLKRFESYIKKMSKRIGKQCNLSSMDSYDLEQEGSISVVNAIKSFNGDNFTSYCKKSINNSMINAIRKSNIGKNKPFIDYISLSNTNEEDDEDKSPYTIDSKSYNPEKEYIDKESEKELAITINDTLSELEKKIFQLYIDGFSYLEISKKVDKSVKSVDNAIQRIRKKLSNKIA